MVSNWGSLLYEMCTFSKDDAKIQQTHTALWACVGFCGNKIE